MSEDFESWAKNEIAWLKVHVRHAYDHFKQAHHGPLTPPADVPDQMGAETPQAHDMVSALRHVVEDLKTRIASLEADVKHALSPDKTPALPAPDAPSGDAGEPQDTNGLEGGLSSHAEPHEPAKQADVHIDVHAAQDAHEPHEGLEKPAV